MLSSQPAVQPDQENLYRSSYLSPTKDPDATLQLSELTESEPSTGRPAPATFDSPRLSQQSTSQLVHDTFLPHPSPLESSPIPAAAAAHSVAADAMAEPNIEFQHVVNSDDMENFKRQFFALGRTEEQRALCHMIVTAEETAQRQRSAYRDTRNQLLLNMVALWETIRQQHHIDKSAAIDITIEANLHKFVLDKHWELATRYYDLLAVYGHALWKASKRFQSSSERRMCGLNEIAANLAAKKMPDAQELQFDSEVFQSLKAAADEPGSDKSWHGKCVARKLLDSPPQTEQERLETELKQYLMEMSIQDISSKAINQARAIGQIVLNALYKPVGSARMQLGAPVSELCCKGSLEVFRLAPRSQLLTVINNAPHICMRIQHGSTALNPVRVKLAKETVDVFLIAERQSRVLETFLFVKAPSFKCQHSASDRYMQDLVSLDENNSLKFNDTASHLDGVPLRAASTDSNWTGTSSDATNTYAASSDSCVASSSMRAQRQRGGGSAMSLRSSSAISAPGPAAPTHIYQSAAAFMEDVEDIPSAGAGAARTGEEMFGSGSDQSLSQVEGSSSEDELEQATDYRTSKKRSHSTLEEEPDDLPEGSSSEPATNMRRTKKRRRKSKKQCAPVNKRLAIVPCPVEVGGAAHTHNFVNFLLFLGCSPRCNSSGALTG